ncbi:MAG: L,D-transpeptidase [Lactobacillus sp.]|jgi:D-alanyl-D-alanine carboxypeptidase (penicillin-binding protein 5/6)|nr:L,D-transpeptidase [Lactobacillus sp.]MCH3905690.1 L,D-transpeptidase [Lactobacillus sp.]MCI1466437.1 L,D-transpeptidase [Lactobacillus sp.]MCI1481156.1 L,D-transpeptidase [Lactobacillus sp.]MCI1883680.1 L,D-transpeptidase [Lactobacillus sp.]
MKKEQMALAVALAAVPLWLGANQAKAADTTGVETTTNTTETSSSAATAKTDTQTQAPAQKADQTTEQAQTQTPTAVQTVVKINYTGRGGVAVWNTYQAGRHVTGKYLPKNSSWKSFAQIKPTGETYTWYNLGGNQWVSGQYAIDQGASQVSKPTQPTQPTKPTQPAADSNFEVVNRNGKVTVYYTGRGKVAVWNSYGQGRHVTGKYLNPGSAWKTFKVAYPKENGWVWYNLGGNQWITSQYTTDQTKVADGKTTQAPVQQPAKKPNAYAPYADPSDMRKPMQWRLSSETKAYPNLRNVRNLWVRVSILGNRTYIMSGGQMLYCMYSSAGRVVNGRSLTPTGTYHVQAERGLTFAGGHYWVSWKDHGVYLFHSTVTKGYNGPYDLSQTKYLGTQPASHGCVRLTVSDAHWLYNQLPTGTRVVIANR